MKVIYTNFELSIAKKISSTSGSANAALQSSSNTNTTLATAEDCRRDSSGDARFWFAVSHGNVSKETAGVASGRNLLSTPCSATDGTTVRNWLATTWLAYAVV